MPVPRNVTPPTAGGQAARGGMLPWGHGPVRSRVVTREARVDTIGSRSAYLPRGRTVDECEIGVIHMPCKASRRPSRLRFPGNGPVADPAWGLRPGPGGLRSPRGFAERAGQRPKPEYKQSPIAVLNSPAVPWTNRTLPGCPLMGSSLRVKALRYAPSDAGSGPCKWGHWPGHRGRR